MYFHRVTLTFYHIEGYNQTKRMVRLTYLTHSKMAVKNVHGPQRGYWLPKQRLLTIKRVYKFLRKS